MSKTHVVTARLDEETMARVDQLAKAQGRSRSWLVADAVRRAVEQEADFLAFLQKGVESADRRELTAQDEVFRAIRARRTQNSDDLRTEDRAA